MNKPRLLDLYCKAGGATRGYQLAGFDVTGVDIEPQPHYIGDRFIQADAIQYVAQYGWMYDAITASPPCQVHTWASKGQRNKGVEYPDFLPQTRFMLQTLGIPYVIENVVGAPMVNPMVLCGTMFGLRVFRHRQFESNVMLLGPGRKCCHKGKKIGFDENSFMSIAGHGGDGSGKLKNWQSAIGIDWMTKKEITQAIPPAYTYFIGKQLMQFVQKSAEIVEIDLVKLAEAA